MQQNMLKMNRMKKNSNCLFSVILLEVPFPLILLQDHLTLIIMMMCRRFLSLFFLSWIHANSWSTSRCLSIKKSQPNRNDRRSYHSKAHAREHWEQTDEMMMSLLEGSSWRVESLNPHHDVSHFNLLALFSFESVYNMLHYTPHAGIFPFRQMSCWIIDKSFHDLKHEQKEQTDMIADIEFTKNVKQSKVERYLFFICSTQLYWSLSRQHHHSSCSFKTRTQDMGFEVSYLPVTIGTSSRNCIQLLRTR